MEVPDATVMKLPHSKVIAIPEATVMVETDAAMV